MLKLKLSEIYMKICDIRMCYNCCDNKKWDKCKFYIFEIRKDFWGILEIDFKSICMVFGYENNNLKYICCKYFVVKLFVFIMLWNFIGIILLKLLLMNMKFVRIKCRVIIM